MTYSRPGNSRVSINAPGKIAQNLEISVRNSSTVSQNGAQRNNVNPDRIYQNGMAKAAQIGKFVDFFTETIQPEIVKEIDRRAQVEVGQALDQSGFTPTELVNGASPEAIDVYKDLSSKAQDDLAKARDITAINSYKNRLPALYESSSILTNLVGNTPEIKEQRAVEMARLRALAQEESGLSQVSPYALAQNAQNIGVIEAAATGAAYKKRLNAGSLIARSTQSDAGAVALVDGYKGLSQVAIDDEAGSAPLTLGLGASIEELTKTIQESEGQAGTAIVLAETIRKAAISIKDPEEREAFLQAVAERMTTPLLATDGETDIASIPIASNGATIRTTLQGLEDQTEELAGQQRLAAGFRQLQEYQVSGNVDGFRGLKEQLIREAKTPQEIKQILSIESTLSQPTALQRRNRFALEKRIAEGEDRNSLLQEVSQGVLDGTYSNDYGLRFMDAAQQNQGVLSPSVKNAQTLFRQGLSDESSKPINDKYTEEIKDLTKGEDKKQFAVEQFWDDVEYQLSELLEKGVDGKPVDPAKAFGMARDIEMTKRREAAKANNPKGTKAQPSPAEKLKADLVFRQEQVLQASREAGGTLTIPSSAIRPEVLANWQSLNPGLVFEELSETKQRKLLYQSFEGGERTPQQVRALVKQVIEGASRDIYKPDVEEQPVYDRRGRLQSGQRTRTLPQPEAPRGIWTRDRRGRRRKWIPSEKVPTVQEQANSLQSPAVAETVAVLDKVSELGTTGTSSEQVRDWYNNNGFGAGAMEIAGNFLNMFTGASPANAGNIDYATPDSLEAFHQAWEFGSNGLKTKPLPQVSATAEARLVPTAVSNDRHELFVMIGVAEGTRTPSGGYTQAYYGHSDPGDNNYNRGTVSGGRDSGASPEMVDLKWMGRLSSIQQRIRPRLIVMGLMPGTQGYNRVMFNIMDLEVQSPAANRDFIGKLFTVRKAGWSIEAIAKARADSFINPATGRLEAPGFGNNYQNLIKDQRSRAGVYDYRRRV